MRAKAPVIMDALQAHINSYKALEPFFFNLIVKVVTT